MTEYRLIVDNQPDFHFNGTIIGYAASDSESGHWTELTLFETVGEVFVCHEVNHGKRTKNKGTYTEDINEVFQFFGYGWLAKQLYANANIDASQKIG